MNYFKKQIRSIYRLFRKNATLENYNACGILKTRGEYRKAIRIIKDLHFPIHNDNPKNWDALAAFTVLREHLQDKSSGILDAGGETYSTILEMLRLDGYTNLTCVNLDFKDRFDNGYLNRGCITFEYGDITDTKYANNYFAGICCLSVIEHGVDMVSFFREMARILNINGVLFVSTDYWKEPVNTLGKTAYGAPIKIFDKEGLLECISIAEQYGFKLLAPLELESINKIVRWEKYSLKYTFIYFALEKIK